MKKNTLYLKFILVYIVFGFLSIFCVSLISSTLILNRVEKNISSSLYKEAILFSNDYLPDYFSGNLNVTF